MDLLDQKTKLQTLKSDLLQYEMDWTTKSKSQEVQMQELKNSLNELERKLEENNLKFRKKSY